ncbi:hypothetical protein SODALDRAFT_283469 [Sodiomyces alkalinus F11]|uniref:Pumilio domain-containing protein n=1 Tax=Sodiomyces alkalinus (strain CBS 110278 / VKM F-3762 / F11) TaxID=1314773 RepID=A0A3N2PNA2_SODAK|nr:hypothetical protein SODALDRAFT_283469 [Sodiomyces alkalinus F11]ROT35904.1 hypothetical protein SODALDRAFT_283469 [Sodiomyces alkalinus F11]
MSTNRSDQLPIGYLHQSASVRSNSPSNTSPVDSAPGSAIRSSFGIPSGLNHPGKMATNTRSGAGSPSHEMPGSARLFSKRAREIQAQEGLPGMPVNPWGGPPTSGNSTPLRENIPESPTDGFPDFVQLPTPESLPMARRARAGTLPSRFSPGGVGLPPAVSKSARPTPSHTPFQSPSPGLEAPESLVNNSTLLSRLRAGSMPQRDPYPAGGGSPFGPSIFSSSWNPSGVGRERASTLASIASVGSNGPSSPAQSQFSKEGGGESDVHMRTLDYLGLAETPQPPRAQLATPFFPPNYNELSKASRFRSYSVNNKDKYAEEEDDYDEVDAMTLESHYAAQLQDQLAATNAAIRNHNLAVQAFASQATRPRARTTAGVIDPSASRLMRSYLPNNGGVPPTIPSADMRLPDEKNYDDLPQAVAAMNLARSNSRNAGLLNAEDQGLEGPTSALWLGSIPTSTTTSTLTEMFKTYGQILSARVLTHKNCGFVNFERTESAITAKANMNGKEIFPGAGPIRINFAKPPSASNTPGHDGAFPSPSPDPFSKNQENGQGGAVAAAAAASTSTTAEGTAATAQPTNAAPTVPPLHEMTADILRIVRQFQATEEDVFKTSRSLQSAVQFTAFVDEIPPVREPTHTRVHDAPKLRDVRKRIDNQSLSKAEIEKIAVEMLPEIAELSADYLGNTVVQKLFEHCSDDVRDAMLAEIAPHMAEIGVHKNGTWAAQKIIDVCKTPHQLSLIVEYLRPYTMPLFLDQYGNYVLQGCLKFGPPYNDFIFETMMSRMWEIAQGRFGARAMRACLESHHTNKDQQRILAAAIALHSVQLATNANGALLLTWYLDTCTFPQRRTVLAPQLVPFLVHLCTHKVAYLTVLKVINQKSEPEARDTILTAMFFTPNDHVLEAILSDHACGAALIFKVLTTPFFDESIRTQVVEKVKSVLVRIKAQPSQGYKRLMDEVGLSTRSSGGGGSRDAGHGSNHNGNEARQRPTSRQANANGHQQHPGHANKPFYNPLPSAVNPNYEAGYGGPRNETPDANMGPYPPYGAQNPMYNSANPAMPPAPQQTPYQQNMMQRGTPAMNNYYPPMQSGYSGYNSPSAGMDQYRNQNMPTGSPIQPAATQMPPMAPGQPAPYSNASYGMNMGMSGGYGYGNMGGMQNMPPYMQQEQANTRRGRVGGPPSSTKQHGRKPKGNKN